MKKITLTLLIIAALPLCFLSACSAEPFNDLKETLTSEKQNQPLFELVDSLDFDEGTKTTVSFSLSGGMEKSYGYDVEVYNDGFTLSVYDGNEKSYSSSAVSSISAAKADYEKQCDSQDGGFDGNLLGIVFLKANELFNLSSSTVRSVTTKQNGDGTTTYTPKLHESRLKTSLPCFENLFLEIKDVLGLSFTADEMGTKTIITVNMTAEGDNLQAPVNVLLSVTHTKTVKVIY